MRGQAHSEMASVAASTGARTHAGIHRYRAQTITQRAVRIQSAAEGADRRRLALQLTIRASMPVTAGTRVTDPPDGRGEVQPPGEGRFEGPEQETPDGGQEAHEHASDAHVSGDTGRAASACAERLENDVSMARHGQVGRRSSAGSQGNVTACGVSMHWPEVHARSRPVRGAPEANDQAGRRPRGGLNHGRGREA